MTLLMQRNLEIKPKENCNKLSSQNTWAKWKRRFKTPKIYMQARASIITKCHQWYFGMKLI